ncbi:zinc metalloproteinase nas-4 isoform X2 [Nematostella vectensis]|uniref:zinc metalloproteinase nas-4 isoform X2 n=1 Tax=Nematostella vectensis TaxID=45351 RepID=UPI00138FC430|nr:zinc metalloproteinase nas-4 isoform X2 [Nematostella vectensis]
MGHKNWRNFSLLWCLLCIVVIGGSQQASLTREDNGGIFEGYNDYDDTDGELSAQQKKEYAWRQAQRTRDQADDDVLRGTESEDESVEDERARQRKEWFMNAMEKFTDVTNNDNFEVNFKTKEASRDDAHDKTSQRLEPGETDEDRLALLREEAKMKRQEKKKKSKESENKKDFVPIPGQLFEGDIVMTEHFRNHVLGNNVKRDGMQDKDKLWPKDEKTGLVRVPYVLSKDIHYNDYSKTEKKIRIDDAISTFNRLSCIRFVEKTPEDKDYVHFIVNKSMCYSSVGRQGGEQKISIGNGCERLGTVEHEMLHSLGFIHEQSRPDRDDYVEVKWDNIKKGLSHNFRKYPRYLVKSLTPYDFDSCLHYHNKAFTNDGEPTLIDKEDPSRVFGQRKQMSKNDVRQLNKEYACEGPSKELLDELEYE